MKKLLSFLFLLTLILSGSYIYGQGLENFNNYPETTNAYHDGTFAGQDGSTWSYFQCRGDSAIVAPTPTLGKNRTPASEVTSGTLPNGCGILSFDYKQPFSSNVNLDVYVNGLLVFTAVSSSEQGVIKNTGPITVNTSGDFVIDFKQQNTSSGQVSIDNITWTAYGSGPLPEPTNYPTAFTATPSAFTINLSWVDAAAGAQAPTAYLVLGSEEDNIDLPIDGIPEPNDPDLSDGTGALNILPGVQSCQFAGLQSNKPFYFKIFSYTNTGTSINYKTNDVPPSANATTPNFTIINYENFNDGTFGTWSQLTVVGDTSWIIDLTHGVAGSPCAKMSGYFATASHQTEAWLISPAMNFNLYTDEVLSFQTAKNYTGPDLEPKISHDYDGVSDPNSFTWTPLTATLSAGGWVWTLSGDIDVSGDTGSAVYIAFKYTSTDTESTTWEVDEVLTTGIRIVGVPESESRLNSFTVSPNPGQGVFKLTFSDNSQKEIRITSLIGKEVYSATTNQVSLGVNLNELPAGVYFVKVNQAGSSQSEVKKLIIR